ncbi:MAG: hypothetical protein K8F54_11645 [Altibacter sp.]|uniref:hypothetical protein n=1 Tax=Altibacter sp. TaxID=2024823 RepID=UPI001DDBE4CF|nr:hypothetical protein [Altibacter sp.]MBZ0328253.1 hypothetical protein [Altibacter sp.]
MNRTISILLYFLVCNLYGQVGIGTLTPHETLEVNGDLIVEGLEPLENSTSLVGADDVGNLTILNLDNQLTLENNRLELSRSIYYSIGDTDLSGISVGPGNLVHNIDLEMGSGEINEGKTVINIIALPSNIKITGIDDGVDGQHLFVYNSVTKNIVFIDESDPKSLNSLPRNRMKVLAGSETLAGTGSVEFIYDGNAQRWILLSIHD